MKKYLTAAIITASASVFFATSSFALSLSTTGGSGSCGQRDTQKSAEQKLASHTSASFTDTCYCSYSKRETVEVKTGKQIKDPKTGKMVDEVKKVEKWVPKGKMDFGNVMPVMDSPGVPKCDENGQQIFNCNETAKFFTNKDTMIGTCERRRSDGTPVSADGKTPLSTGATGAAGVLFLPADTFQPISSIDPSSTIYTIP